MVSTNNFFSVVFNVLLLSLLTIGVREINDTFTRTLARILHRPFTSSIPMTSTPLTSSDNNQSNLINKCPKTGSDRSHPYSRH